MREYSKAEEAEQAEGSAGATGLREEANAKRRQLEQWSASAYGEVLRTRPCSRASILCYVTAARLADLESRRLDTRRPREAASIVYLRYMLAA